MSSSSDANRSIPPTTTPSFTPFRRILLEGNICAGKTTVVRAVERHSGRYLALVEQVGDDFLAALHAAPRR